jgi:murein L,D-transpeptidase YafK
MELDFAFMIGEISLKEIWLHGSTSQSRCASLCRSYIAELLVYRRDEPVRMGGNGQNNLNGYLACATTDISDRVVQHHFQSSG